MEADDKPKKEDKWKPEKTGEEKGTEASEVPKEYSGLFEGTKGDKEYNGFASYNKAGSKDVRLVEEVNEFDASDHDRIPVKGRPNSVTKVYKNGKLDKERYYGENGDVYLDIDYTNHGNSKMHPIVPHQHLWTKDGKGNIERQDGTEINRKEKGK